MSKKDPFWERENKKQLDRLLKSAEEGNSAAMFALGDNYYEGILVDKNIDEALKWYRLAANAGNIYAQSRLVELNQSVGNFDSYTSPNNYDKPKRKNSSISKPRKKSYDGNFGEVDAGLSALYNDERAGYEEKTFHFKESYGRNKRRGNYDYDTDFDDYGND